MRYNNVDGPHEPRESGICEWEPRCYDIVEEHQVDIENPDVPEFTIETCYYAGCNTSLPDYEPNVYGNASLFASGWKWTLRWNTPKGPRVKYRFGYESEASALKAAKARADEEARALIPVRITKYTPRI